MKFAPARGLLRGGNKGFHKPDDVTVSVPTKPPASETKGSMLSSPSPMRFTAVDEAPKLTAPEPPKPQTKPLLTAPRANRVPLSSARKLPKTGDVMDEIVHKFI